MNHIGGCWLQNLRCLTSMFDCLLLSKLVGFRLKTCTFVSKNFRSTRLDEKSVDLYSKAVCVDGSIVIGETKGCRELRAYVQQFFPTENLGAVVHILLEENIV